MSMCVGVDPNLINKVQDPSFLDQIAETYRDISGSIKQHGPWSRAWVGEAGGAYNSGGKYVSHSFVDGFWFVLCLFPSAFFLGATHTNLV